MALHNVQRGCRPPIVPYFGYRDAATALEWLAETFGLETVQRMDGPDGQVMHAEMRFGSGVIMLGTATDAQRAQIEAGRAAAGPGVYLVVDDVDAHYERAKAAGAEIVYPPEATDFGTRRYRARDGYEWSFGTYQPSAER